MTKIAMVCHRYYPDIGGVETHVREISERLARRGFDVEVICTDPAGKYPKQEYYNRVKITRFKAFAPKNTFYFAPQLYFYIKNQVFDIVHAYNYHATPAILASLAVRKRFIFTPCYHGLNHFFLRTPFFKPYQYMRRLVFKKAEKAISVSKYEMKLIESDFRIPRSKLFHIPNGLNVEEFKNIKEIKNESRTILYAGRLEFYKGVQYIIKALPLLSDYRLKIIGKGSYENNLRRLAKKMNLEDRIDWLKDIEREELLSQFKSADVFINLSKFESYGITVSEALACGTPCIVAMGSALEDFVDGEGCVGLYYPINIKILADTIRRRKRIDPVKMPDWDNIVSGLVEIYSSFK